MKLYLLHIFQGIEASVRGPYPTDDDRLKAAKEVYIENRDDGDSVHRLDIDDSGVPTVADFSGGEMEDEDEEETT
jgi:hypothetical protein